MDLNPLLSYNFHRDFSLPLADSIRNLSVTQSANNSLPTECPLLITFVNKLDKDHARHCL